MIHRSCGKTSLLRVLRGLWNEKSGSYKFGRKTVIFISQKPFFTNGSLRRQVTYPLEVVSSVSHDQFDIWIKMKLIKFGLGDLIDRVNGNLDAEPDKSWSEILSPGETQRMAIIRSLFHSPEILILDEATSALSLDMEELCYREVSYNNLITLISVGHRDSLKKFHSKHLQILSEGQYSLHEI
ncbi:ABCD4 [Lepeophtheirus salmonis]|uniref:ABCD4 n=1 Tax=Lepeophtheirus salmonis TaxID=72036 RepID=A0A7R8CP69_LEPSM|nr:ABCD4 [Lepeophtheirus salmonis]CAF2850908.1 ABCD4 [Lepeophtheirus salmonis]